MTSQALLVALVGPVILLLSIPVQMLAKRERTAWLIALAASLVALVSSSYAFYLHPHIAGNVLEFISIGGRRIYYSFVLDRVSITMSELTSIITFIVILFSHDYMHGENGYTRYYSALALFEASMIGVALAHNLLTLTIFWALVGFSSYLLIGFWYHKPRARRAARLAIVVTGSGDVALVLATAYAAIHGIPMTIPSASLPAIVLSLIVFAAATKSAQFPLHIWLLEAMEAPTTVSALLHSATMVAAGAYLLERINGALIADRGVSEAVLVLGSLTAIYAAILALRELDAKRLLAYSTISNLGIMFAAATLSSPLPSFSHLFVHAWFKATLFLSIAPAIHYLGTTSLTDMGGLRRYMPWGFAAALLAALAQVGLPLYGSWVSHALISSASSEALRYVLLADAALSGLYIGRWLALAFLGSPRTGIGVSIEEAYEKISYALLIILIPGSILLYQYALGLNLHAVLASSEAAIGSAVGLVCFVLAVYVYSRQPLGSGSQAAVEAIAVPLVYFERLVYALYLEAVPPATLWLGSILRRADKGAISAQYAVPSSLATSTRRLDELRNKGIQFMLLFGFSLLAIVLAIAFLVV